MTSPESKSITSWARTSPDKLGGLDRKPADPDFLKSFECLFAELSVLLDQDLAGFRMQ